MPLRLCGVCLGLVCADSDDDDDGNDDDFVELTEISELST